ncbi:hypothetical protein BpHYR1_031548 [Brachionus plicatilis]|uniref:Uncharacterized protein n=1 Tax=Brachionus plicatilis TaxID=10195 RepID=A0A3M7QAS7_BRAPC|nr:hypothetical protein BpHYR1_031548 [Brachionus plicatilis]
MNLDTEKNKKKSKVKRKMRILEDSFLYFRFDTQKMVIEIVMDKIGRWSDCYLQSVIANALINALKIPISLFSLFFNTEAPSSSNNMNLASSGINTTQIIKKINMIQAKL